MAAPLNKEVWGIIAFMVIAGGWIIPLTVSVIAKNWRKARESEQLAFLKQSMIERGMSVEEIERVINAGMPGSKPPEVKNSSWIHGQQQSIS
jgi:hypothetical protein